MKTTVVLLLTLFGALTLRGQVLNPVLNDAFLLPRGGFQVTTGYSALGLSFDGEREGYLKSLDFQLGYGISRRVSIVARYEKSWYANQMFEQTAANFLFIGPEIMLKENWISLYVPFGTRFLKEVEDDKYSEITPTLNFSLPLGSKVYFNPAVELGFVFCEDCTEAPFLGLNLGLGARPSERLSFFAEYGLTYSTEDFGEGHFYSINGGIAYLMSLGRKSE
jgi:hypothetical protein